MAIKNDSCLSVFIAGFGIVISPLPALEKKIGSKVFLPFVTHSRDCRMRIDIVNNGPIPEIPGRNIVFSSDSHWQLYKNKDKYYFKITSREKGRDFISRLAVFPSDFSSGEIYTYSPVGDRDFPLSYPLDQILFIHLAALHRGVLLHACGALIKGNGFVFAGHSGAGKSTIGGLVKKYARANILSDDRIIVKKEKNRFMIYGTPWHGTLPYAFAEQARLEKVFFLKKARANKIIQLSPLEAMRRLGAVSFLPYWDKSFMRKSLSTISELANKNIFFELSFVADSRVIEVINDAI